MRLEQNWKYFQFYKKMIFPFTWYYDKKIRTLPCGAELARFRENIRFIH